MGLRNGVQIPFYPLVSLSLSLSLFIFYFLFLNCVDILFLMFISAHITRQFIKKKKLWLVKSQYICKCK